MNRDEAIAALESLPETARLSVAAIKPTDVIVLECDALLPAQAHHRLRGLLEGIWPNNKCVVLDRGHRLKIAESDTSAEGS